VVPDQWGPEIVFYTKDYEIIVNFKTELNGLKGLTNMVMYWRVSDSKKAVRLMYGDPSVSKMELFRPMKKDDIEKVLSHYTEDNKFSWLKLKGDHWRRSDGAEAAFDHGIFTVATQEAADTLSWFPK
jgi:hypothetical protein